MKTYERNDRMKAAIVINKYCVYKFIVTSCCSPANTTEDEIKKLDFFRLDYTDSPLPRTYSYLHWASFVWESKKSPSFCNHDNLLV